MKSKQKWETTPEGIKALAIQKRYRELFFSNAVFVGREGIPCAYRHIYSFFIQHCYPKDNFRYKAYNTQIAAWCGCSNDTVERAIHCLIKYGLIKRLHRGSKGHKSVYEIETDPVTNPQNEKGVTRTSRPLAC